MKDAIELAKELLVTHEKLLALQKEIDSAKTVTAYHSVGGSTDWYENENGPRVAYRAKLIRVEMVK